MAGPQALMAWPQAWLAGPQAWLAGPEGGRKNKWTTKQTENLAILQDYVPSWLIFVSFIKAFLFFLLSFDP